MTWAIKWRSDCRLDGRCEYLLGRFGFKNSRAPTHLRGYTKMVFQTRQQARDHIKENYGYIRNRPDLRREPHGWRMPVPVKVTVTVAEAGEAA